MNINRGQRYIILRSIRGWIVFDRLDRVQIGDDCEQLWQAKDRRALLLRRPERV